MPGPGPGGAAVLRAAAGRTGQLSARPGAACSRGEEIPAPAPSVPPGPRGSRGEMGPGVSLRAARSPRTFQPNRCLQPRTDPCPRCWDAAELVHPALPLGKLRHGWVGTAALPGRARPGPLRLPPAQLGQAGATTGVPLTYPSGCWWTRGCLTGTGPQGSKPHRPPPPPPDCGHLSFGVPLAQHLEPLGAPATAPLSSPQRSDPRLLSQFFFADERVTRVVAEINRLDAELDPQQYLVLLNQLHLSQVQGQPRPQCHPASPGRLWVMSLPSPGSLAGGAGAHHGGVHPHAAAQP